MRLGFSVSVLGRPGLHSHDSRRWQNAPHLSISLAYLRDVLLYLDTQNIRMYRLASDLAPYLTHPDLPQFHQQIEECQSQLQAVGELVRRLEIRLSFHAPAYVLLNTPDPIRLRQSIAELAGMAAIFDAMSLGPEAVIILHVGGYYQDRAGAMATFAERFEHLPEPTRQRIVLEHDDRRFSVQDVLWIHRRTGVRLAFDHLHHQLYNPNALPTTEALSICLATWPPDQTPKIHFSTPATEMVRDRKGAPHPPRLNRHSHYINPFQFIDFLGSLPKMRDFDIMLEAKARDLALLQLRKQLLRYAPAQISRFDII